MRILVLSDIHGSDTGITTTLELAERYNPHIVVICGDITQFGPHEWAVKYLEQIPARTVAVHGNCDPKDLDVTFARASALSLHKKRHTITGLPFIGAGGSDHTPFNTIFEFGDETFTGWLDPLMVENAVLVTHAPAYGILDWNMSGKHLGSKSLRKVVDRWKPILFFSGHMHEARGVEVHGKTVCVNPGPAKNGFGALVDLVNPLELVGVAEKEKWGTVRGSVEARLLDV